MSPDETRDGLALLAAHFGLSPSTRLEVGTREPGPAGAALAFAQPERGRIVFSPRLRPERYEDVLVHEFAHLLAHKERGLIMRGRRADHHGPHFVDALLRVVEAWYGSLSAYPWHAEYKAVRKRAGVATVPPR